MASIYTDTTIYRPELWASEGLQILFENLGIRSKVHTDFSTSVAERGDTVNTRFPAVFTAASTGSAGEVSANQTPNSTKVTVVMSSNKEVTFPIRDVDNAKAIVDLRNEFFEPAVLAILRVIEDDGLAAMVDGTNGFADSDDSNVINTIASGDTPDTFKLIHVAKAAYYLDNSKVPDDGQRHMVISHKQLHDLVTAGGSSDLLLKANELGGSSALRTRELGNLFGFNIAMQQGVPASAAAGGGYPDAAIHTAPFFHKNAVAYVTRPLPGIPPMTGAAVSSQSFDNQNLRVSIGYDITNKHTLMSLDVLYGWKVMRQSMGGTIKSASTI